MHMGVLASRACLCGAVGCCMETLPLALEEGWLYEYVQGVTPSALDQAWSAVARSECRDPSSRIFL